MTNNYDGKSAVPEFLAYSSKCDVDKKPIFRMAKVGSPVATKDGLIGVWSDDGLKSAAESFRGKRISVNHGDGEFGVIDNVWYKDGILYGKYDVKSPNINKWLNEAPNLIGNSIELSRLVMDEDNNIIDADGFGVSLTFPPHTSLCDAPGCGFEAFASEEEIISLDAKFEEDKILEEQNMEEIEKLKGEMAELKAKYDALEAEKIELAGFASKAEEVVKENVVLKADLDKFKAAERVKIIEGLASKFDEPEKVKELLKDADDAKIAEFKAFASLIKEPENDEGEVGAGAEFSAEESKKYKGEVFDAKLASMVSSKILG